MNVVCANEHADVINKNPLHYSLVPSKNNSHLVGSYTYTHKPHACAIRRALAAYVHSPCVFHEGRCNNVSVETCTYLRQSAYLHCAVNGNSGLVCAVKFEQFCFLSQTTCTMITMVCKGTDNLRRVPHSRCH
jgi:hypothetical protein